eukprot:403346650
MRYKSQLDSNHNKLKNEIIIIQSPEFQQSNYHKKVTSRKLRANQQSHDQNDIQKIINESQTIDQQNEERILFESQLTISSSRNQLNDSMLIGSENGNSQKKLQRYMNVTGPGDYEIKGFTGRQTLISNKRNEPSFSFGSKPKKMQFISKELLGSQIGKDSENAGFRSYNLDSYKTVEPKISMTKEPRFKDDSISRYKKQLPVMYQSIDVTREKLKDSYQRYKQIAIGNSKRSDFTRQSLQLELPGPADYDISTTNLFSSKNINQTKSTLSRNDKHQNHNTSISLLPNISKVVSRNCQEDLMNQTIDTKQYSKNLEFKMLGKESPGPGQFNLVTDNTWNKIEKAKINQSFVNIQNSISIPKSRRQLLGDVKIQHDASPSSYDLEGIFNYKRRQGSNKAVKFATSIRDYDPSKYSSLNRALVLKGL